MKNWYIGFTEKFNGEVIMSKAQFKKLHRLLRIIRNRNYQGKKYQWYWDNLFDNDTNYKMIFGEFNKTNNRISLYKIWGV